MTLILYTAGAIVALGIIILLIPIRFQLRGKIISDSSSTIYSGKILVGGKRFGIAYSPTITNNLCFGPYHHPWFHWTITSTLRSNKRKSASSHSPWIPRLKKVVHNRKWRFAFFRSVHWQYLSVKGKIGLENPMHTGILFGAINTISALIPPKVKKTINISPEFNPPLGTDLHGKLNFTFFPASLALKFIQYQLNSHQRKDT